MNALEFEPICVVIGRSRHKMFQAEIQEAVKLGAQFLELRLDILAKAPDFTRLLENKPCSFLATVRRAADGGRWKGTEEARQTLLRQAIVSGFDWVDLETDIADNIRRYQNVKRIVSYHNVREVPADLETIHASMCRQDADVVKLAVRPQSPLDNIRLLNIIKKASKPTIALCMGDLGMPSRVLGAKYGAPFTYAAFNRERGIAPGIPSYQEMKKIYFYPKIDSETRIFGVIGDPVSHSLSPLIHNQAMRQAGINAVYVPFRLPRGESLTDFLNAYDQLPVDGYSVTIPHKEAAAEAADYRDETVLQTKAANTLIRGATGYTAWNTDYQGGLDALVYHLATAPQQVPDATQQPGGESLASKTVLILGAGGAARAFAFAMQNSNALVTLASRTAERAHRLAEEVGCRTVDWAGRHSVLCDIVINCTPVGMHPNVDESPLHPSFFKPGILVFDTVYTPETTLMVKEARQRGAQVLTGVELFVRQAALQFKLFTGQKINMEQIRQTIRRALSPIVNREEV